MCLLWTGLHTSLQSLNLSQVYLSNLQWADTETCQLKPESIKSPFPATFSLCNETTGFYICLGERILQDVPAWIILICSLIRNVAPALSEEPSLGWGHGSSPSMNWKCSWDFIDGVCLPLPVAFCPYNTLMTSTGPSLYKNMDYGDSDFFRGKVGNSPGCRSLTLSFVPGQALHTDPRDH